MRTRRTAPAIGLLTILLTLTGCATGDEPDGPVPATNTTRATPSSEVTAAEHTPIPRTKASLRVPEGMQLDESLPGISRKGTRTTVVVNELPLPDKTPEQGLAEVTAGFAEPQAEAKGFRFDEVQRDVSIAGFPGVTAIGIQRAAQGTFGKTIVVFAAEDALVMLSGTLEPDDPLSPADLREVLTDVRWGAGGPR
ncbi:hypothetical protein [Amycolatopsis aidingensis]|uniref:hypothetical protein n=1 Tax=Amycolatopsis aidingensis TaxID=2842453 RepID=UPI001C0C82CC|nr:hypothetical protein [Amycolatopsis aidingensis]